MYFIFNPFTPRSDKQINSPYNFHDVKQLGDENFENRQVGDSVLKQNQILRKSQKRFV